ncbi:MAG: PIN domain-containing protein [archaeon]
MRARVVLDTNFLMMPFQFGVDIFTELERVMTVPYDIIVLDATIKELEGIATRAKGVDKHHAKAALTLIKRVGHTIVPADDIVDEAIVTLGQEPDVFVASSDRGVISRCPRVILLRQKSHLAIRLQNNQATQ